MTDTAVVMAQNKLIEAGLAFRGDFNGCSDEEIISIEDRFHIQLPKTYKDFLRAMGRSAGDFMVGTDYSFPKMFEIRKGAEELLRICQSGFNLPATAYVFLSHQGYNYEWFDCNHQAYDPPVFLFTELEKEPRKVAESFSAWLLGAVDDDITAYREVRSR